jgi:hypothetical protein
MVDPIVERHIRHEVRINAIEAAEIESVLVRLGTAAVVGLDAAAGTEIVFGRHRVEAIDGEQLLALDDSQAFQWNGAHDRAFSAAHRTSATTGVDDAVWEVEFQNHATAVTACTVSGLDDGVADSVDGLRCH